ncbi:MAG: hypothetical protein IKH04_12020 [Kiritimatiellae bacterium]|nr:hypothetical protein [Kiritimatiellia bacterium]
MTRKFAITIPCLALGSLLIGAPPAPLHGGSPYGVCSHITRDGFGYRDESCRRIAAAGIGAVRSDVDWKRCQPAKDSPFDFSFYDAAVESAEAAGLRFLPILMRPPKWASPVWEHLEEWGAFVEAFVRRYGERCPDIEIMNETNLRVFWGSEPDAEKYCDVLKAAYAAAKRADPRVRVMLGGLNGVPLPYVRRILERGGAGAFDAICVHPYTHPYPPEPALERDLEALRGLLAEFGAGEKPVVVTELGWPTHQANVEGLPLMRTLLAAARPGQASWRCVYATTTPVPDGQESPVAAAIAGALPPGSTCEELHGDALRARLAAGGIDAVVYPFDETFPADTSTPCSTSCATAGCSWTSAECRCGIHARRRHPGHSRSIRAARTPSRCAAGCASRSTRTGSTPRSRAKGGPSPPQPRSRRATGATPPASGRGASRKKTSSALGTNSSPCSS